MDTSLVDSLIGKMERAFHLATILQCNFVELGDYTRGVAEGLPEEILQSCKVTISLLNSLKGENDADPRRKQVVEFASRDAAPAHGDVIRAKRDPKRRRCAREELTAAPFCDGHQWRKYGEKSIKGSSFKRSYYRCTYSEDKKCEAKKKVQQKDWSSYLVIHEGQHTCIDGNSMISRPRVVTHDMVPLGSLQGLHLVPRTTITTVATSSVPMFNVSRGCSEINIVGRDAIRGTPQPKRDSQCSTSMSDPENLTDVPLTRPAEVEPLQTSMYDITDIGNGSDSLDEAFSPCNSSSLGFFDIEELLSSKFDCI